MISRAIVQTIAFTVMFALGFGPPLAQRAHAAETGPTKEEEAAALSIVAKKKADDGEFAVAAEIYLQAWRSFPKEHGYLYSAARCFHKAAKWEEAEKWYGEFVTAAPEGHPQRAKAVGYKEEVRRAKTDDVAKAQALEALRKEQQGLAEERAKLQAEREAAAAAATAEKAARDKAQADAAVVQPAQTNPLAWPMAGAGVLATGVGGWLLYKGLQDADDLTVALDDKTPSGKIQGINRDDALALRYDAVRNQVIGGSLFVVGLAATVTGLVMALEKKQPRKFAVAPVPGGMLLAWAF